MSAKYRVAVIGRTGKGNYGHGLDTVWTAVDDVEVVAVADDDEGGRESAKKRLSAKRSYADFRKLLDVEKPDIVSVAPRWLDQHRAMVVACAEAGASIFLEKPMCRDLEEADAMVAACKKSGVKLAIAHQTRYSPTIPVVQKIIRDGLIGDTLELRGRGKEDRRGGGEDLWVLGTHVMDLMRVFFGNPVSCFGRVTQGGRPIRRDDVYEGAEGIGPLAGDHVEAVYRFNNGRTSSFSSHRGAAGRPSRFGLTIHGSKGLLSLSTGYLPSVELLRDPSWSPGRSKAVWEDVSSAGIGVSEPLENKGSHAANVLIVKDLFDAIENDREPLGSIHDARAATEMILSVFESQVQGAPVALPLTNRSHPLRRL